MSRDEIFLLYNYIKDQFGDSDTYAGTVTGFARSATNDLGFKVSDTNVKSAFEFFNISVTGKRINSDLNSRVDQLEAAVKLLVKDVEQLRSTRTVHMRGL
jgi:hypothetical protein